MKYKPNWCKHFKYHKMGWQYEIGNYSIVIVWHLGKGWKFCPDCGAERPKVDINQQNSRG